MDPKGSAAVLITGVYGVGKSSVVEEIAGVLEHRGTPYAALDLDWLHWFDAGDDDDQAEHRMLLRNLGAVVENYRQAGIERFLLAYAVEDEATLEGITTTLSMPTIVVRLTLDLATIETRLGAAVTAGRTVDLHWAGVWLSRGTGVGLEDFMVANDRPIDQVAMEVLERIGWR